MGKINIIDMNGNKLGEIDDGGFEDISQATDEQVAELLNNQLSEEKLEEIKKKWAFRNSNA